MTASHAAPLVLDWRGLPSRLAAALWGEPGGVAAGAGSGWRRAASAVAAPLQRGLLARRLGGRGDPPATPLIVSIGNLAVGGAGKTPVTAALAAALARRGLAGAIVTRGYGSSRRGPWRVRPDDPTAADEARLLAARVPAWPVWQAVDRRAGLAAALASPDQPAPAVVLLEDGHQTARAARHFDVLILDRWRRLADAAGERIEPLAGPLLPWGPYREGAEGAARAACWLIEPAPEDPAGWLARARPAAREPSPAAGGAVLGFRRVMRLPDADRPRAEEAYAVVSGIARPAAFEVGCARLLGRAPRLAVRCDDHATYTEALVGRARAEGRRQGVAAWLTTEKDAIKLAPLWATGGAPLRIVELEVAWLGTKALPDLVEERLRDARSPVQR